MQPATDDAEAQAVERQLAAIEARRGAALAESERAPLRERLAEFRQLARALRAVPLTNADEPLPTVAPRPAGGGA